MQKLLLVETDFDALTTHLKTFARQFPKSAGIDGLDEVDVVSLLHPNRIDPTTGERVLDPDRPGERWPIDSWGAPTSPKEVRVFSIKPKFTPDTAARLKFSQRGGCSLTIQRQKTTATAGDVLKLELQWMGRDNFADKFTLAFRDYCSAQPGWNAKEVPQPGAQVGSLFCLGVCEMEDDYSVDRRKVSPRRFGEWITEYTQRLRFGKVEAEGGYFELDRARQVGNLDDWTIDGQWHSENGALPPVPTVTSGKCTLIQFSLTQLDDGRQYEEPRSKILSWRVGGLPALEVLFAELQGEIEQNWDALQNLKTPVFKGEIKPVHDSGAPQPAVQFTGYVTPTGASAGIVQPSGKPVWVTPTPPLVASAASPAMPQQAAGGSAIEHFDFDCDAPEVAALFAGDGLITRTIPYGLDFGELQITAHDKDIARGYLYSIAFLARLKEEPPVQVGHIALIQSERGHCSAHLKITDDAHIRETRAFDFGQVVVRKYWKQKIHEYLSSRGPEGAAPRQPPADRQSNGETNGKPKGKPGRKSQWSQDKRDAVVEKWETKGSDDARTLSVFLCDEVGEKDDLNSMEPKPVISESQFYEWREDYFKRHHRVITGE